MLAEVKDLEDEGGVGEDKICGDDDDGRKQTAPPGAASQKLLQTYRYTLQMTGRRRRTR
jgi:hypothetical protein